MKIVLDDEAMEALRALHLGANIEISCREGIYMAEIRATEYAPVHDENGEKSWEGINGSYYEERLRKNNLKPDLSQKVRIDRWGGKDRTQIRFKSIVMLVRAGLAEIEEGSLEILDEGIAAGWPHWGPGIDYFMTPPTSIEMEREDIIFEEGEITIKRGYPLAFKTMPVIEKTSSIHIETDNDKLVFLASHAESEVRAALNKTSAQILSGVLTRAANNVARSENVNCGEFEIQFINDQMNFKFSDYPRSFRQAETVLSTGDMYVLSDILNAFARGEAPAARISGPTIDIADPLLVDPASLRETCAEIDLQGFKALQKLV